MDRLVEDIRNSRDPVVKKINEIVDWINEFEGAVEKAKKELEAIENNE